MARYAGGFLGEEDNSKKKRRKKIMIIIIVVIILLILLLVVTMVVGYLISADKKEEGETSSAGAGPDGEPGEVKTTTNEEGEEIKCRAQNNLAYSGTVSASGGTSNPPFATDDDTGSCAATTGKNAYPYYFIFMAQTYAIDSVWIQLPKDSTVALKNLQVRVGSNSESVNTVFYRNPMCWQQAAPVPVDGLVKGDCEARTVGRRLSLQLVAGCGTCVFSVCEVFAYGSHVPT